MATESVNTEEKEVGVKIGIRFSSRSFFIFLSFFFKKEETQAA